MRGEKSEFLRDSTVDFWKWQDRVQKNAGDKECSCTNGRISQRLDDSLATGRFARRWRFNMNLRNGLANWHSLFPVA
jgi:hypothetical protein